MIARRTRVLVVDDSAVARQVIAELLAGAAGTEVECVPDAVRAAQSIQARRPDAVVLDLGLPGTDGLAFLEAQMARDPIPVVVCSARAARGTRAALRALELGAVEVVDKGGLAAGGAAAQRLVRAVCAARLARPPRAGAPALPAPAPLAAPRAWRLLALGASTGGPDALCRLLGAFPADGPAVVVAQHMPTGFTRALAQYLDTRARMEVREARAGDDVRPGRVLVAPGGWHLKVVSVDGRWRAALSREAPVQGHCPSVDVLFHSVARAAGPRAVGALLTGMGADGARGLLAMRHAGAATFAQDRASSVVFGMPAEAVALGAAQRVLALAALPAALLAAAAAPARGPAAAAHR